METLLQRVGVVAKYARLPIAAIALASTLALIAPSDWLSETNREAAQIAFTLSFVTLVISLYTIRRNKIIVALYNVTDDEKKRLRPFFTSFGASFSQFDSVAAGLVKKRILSCNERINPNSRNRAHSIDSSALTYLLAHPELLDA
jgi:hypothetical protein